MRADQQWDKRAKYIALKGQSWQNEPTLAQVRAYQLLEVFDFLHQSATGADRPDAS